MMRPFGALAETLNSGYESEEKRSLEWRLAAGVARQHGDRAVTITAQSAQHGPPCPAPETVVRSRARQRPSRGDQ